MRTQFRKCWLISFLTAEVLALSTSLVAQGSRVAGAKIPDTPDFSGAWVGPDQGHFNRTDIFPGENGKGFAFTAEQPPMQPWAEQKYKANHIPGSPPNDHGKTALDPGMRCFPPGPT